jgi:hypothetical protein
MVVSVFPAFDLDSIKQDVIRGPYTASNSVETVLMVSRALCSEIERECSPPSSISGAKDSDCEQVVDPAHVFISNGDYLKSEMQNI